METTSISRLKARLSHYLRIAHAGEEVIITDRGQAFAKIVSLGANDQEQDPHLQKLASVGLVRMGNGQISDEFWSLPRPSDENGFAAKALLDERREGR